MPDIRLNRLLTHILGGALVVLAAAGAARAEQADRDAPMNIEADSLRYDDVSRTSTFLGNVVITKGTIIMRGRRVVVRQDEQGNQFGTIIGEEKAQGFFRQKREGLDEWIEGQGNRIEYDSQKETVRFVGNAALRRFRGAQLNDESLGNVIIYNSSTEVFTVQGGTGGQVADNPSGRVRAMLTPVPKDDAAATPPPASPAKLRPSTGIDEKRK
ncbi:MAG: lipopolysaccharide transport periplasmic protein LptA [Burkholderiaceae bacterium]